MEAVNTTRTTIPEEKSRKNEKLPFSAFITNLLEQRQKEMDKHHLPHMTLKQIAEKAILDGFEVKDFQGERRQKRYEDAPKSTI